MYCDCVNFFFEKTRPGDKTVFLFVFRLVLQWLPLKLLEVVCVLFTNTFLPGLGTLLPRTYLYADYAAFYNYYSWSKLQSGLGVVRRFLTLLG